MKQKLPIKLWDIVIIILTLGLTGFAAYEIYLRPSSGMQVIIESHGRGRSWVYPLTAEVTLAVPGPLGNTIIRISENQAWVESSPCPDQVCVTSARLPFTGMLSVFNFTACLPNMVILRIEGTDEQGELDYVSQ